MSRIITTLTVALLVTLPATINAAAAAAQTHV
jgi:hypothetical protein